MGACGSGDQHLVVRALDEVLDRAHLNDELSQEDWDRGYKAPQDEVDEEPISARARNTRGKRGKGGHRLHWGDEWLKLELNHAMNEKLLSLNQGMPDMVREKMKASALFLPQNG